MRTLVILALSVLLVPFTVTGAEETPHEKVVRIISSTAPVYAPIDMSAEEQNRAVEINSGLRKLWLSDSVPEEIRVCYALDILIQQLLAAPTSGSEFAEAYKKDITQDHRTLTLYLRSLNERAK